MENKKFQNLCKFISVCNFLLALVCTIITAFVINIWFFVEFYLIIPSGLWVFLTNVIGLLAVVLCIGISLAIIYGAILLWEPKEGGNKVYILYQTMSIICAVVLVVTGIILNIYGLLSILANLLYFILCVGIMLLNAVGYGVKRREVKEIQIKNQDREIGFRAIEGEYAGAVFLMKCHEKIVLGTHPESCQVLFHDRHISRIHCIIRYKADVKKYEIIDCSRNGTFWLNGERLPFGVACCCPMGTIFTIDHQKQMFQFI